MEVKLLDTILHGQLKPWKMAASNKRLAELIKAAKAGTTVNLADLNSQLNLLLQDYPALQQIISSGGTSSTTALQQLIFIPELPAYKDIATQFYYLFINYETIRCFTNICDLSKSWTEPVDTIYQLGKTLKSIKVLTVQTNNELKERNFLTTPDGQSDVVHFALHYLKHTLIALYFSIQEAFKESLTSEISLEDFYLLDLQEAPKAIIPLTKNEATEITETPLQKVKKQPQLTFGFIGDKQSLKTVINQLCIKVDLLKEDISPADILVQLLLSKHIKPGEVAIHLNCDNKNFRYVLQKFYPYFNSLSFVNIEHSKSFYSRQGTLLKANNFSKAKSFDPKEKEEIDNIFKQMK